MMPPAFISLSDSDEDQVQCIPEDETDPVVNASAETDDVETAAVENAAEETAVEMRWRRRAATRLQVARGHKGEDGGEAAEGAEELASHNLP